MIARGEVLVRALSDAADRLHPQIAAQLRASSPVGRGDGVFTVAGSRYRLLNLFARPILGADALVTRFAREVPFTIETVSHVMADGTVVLDTTREFRFPAGAQRIADRLAEENHPGLVRNRLGQKGRIELIEACDADDEGSLRMSTQSVFLRVGRRRIPLGGVLGVRVEVVDGWDAENSRRTIAMRARNPLLGTVLEYRGWYRWRDDAAQADGAEAPGTQ